MTQVQEISGEPRPGREARDIPLGDAEVAAWLADHPEFFHRHPELLPQDAARAVTIDHLRLTQLKRENQALQGELTGMLALIGRNEGIYRQFQTIERRLAAAHDLDTMILDLAQGLEDAFGLERVTVALTIPLAGIPLGEEAASHCLFAPPAELARLFPAPPRPVVRIGLEGFNRPLLFGEWADRIRSEVLSPLLRHHRLLGSLNLGAASPTRFLPSQSTDLLGDLAAFFVACLGRVLPREPAP